MPDSPLARFDVRSRDPEFAHGDLRETYADFTVRPSGSTEAFRFSHTGAVAPRMTVGRMAYSTAAEMDVHAPQDSLLVATRASGALGMRFGRESVRPEVGQALLMPPHTGWEVDLADVELTTAKIDWTAVHQAARSVLGPDAHRPAFTSMVPVSDGAGRYWNSVLEHVGRDVLAHDEVAAYPLVLAEATRSLAAALLVTFPNTALTRLDENRDDQRAEPAVLRRALAFVDEHADEDIGVDDIAAASRIGVRGLQHLFRRHRDCTPLEHLRRVRMARAHVDLRTADPTRGDTVATVAARWGFTHPGRFSVQYRRAYGSSPSETLRS